MPDVIDSPFDAEGRDYPFTSGATFLFQLEEHILCGKICSKYEHGVRKKGCVWASWCSTTFILRAYVGQTAQCISSRLCAHLNNVQKKMETSHLTPLIECCGCKPYFKNSAILCHDSAQCMREIVEVAEVQLDDFECVSTTSMALSEKEAAFLKKSRLG